MSKEEKKEQPDQKIISIAKDASVDFPVDVIATAADPYHLTGEKFQAGTKKAKELVKRGWVTMAMIALLLVSFVGNAQTSVLVDLKSTYDLTSDTVVNADTAYLTSIRVNGPGQTVTIQVVCTENSGTTAGTLTLLGSLDGTNFVALTDSTTVPEVVTETALDVASQTFAWYLANSPFLYYRVSWTGSGTMSNRFSAKLMKH